MQFERFNRLSLRPRLGAPELSVIAPTYNEFDNLDELVVRISEALPDLAWELIIVDDDSPDGTALRARQIARSDTRVRVIQRIGRRGLSSACIEGMMASSAPVLAVIDADLQHDPAMLAEMYEALNTDSADLVSASRYREGGDLGLWSEDRARLSRFATRLVQGVTKGALSDPMSGCFMLRRSVIEETVHALSGKGFKILLDIVLSSDRPLRLAETPCRFDVRRRGESKLTWKVGAALGAMLAEKMVQRTGRRLGRIARPRPYEVSRLTQPGRS